MSYTIRGLKTFIGNEGYGYNVSLYRDGIRVALVIDDASGGAVDFQWLQLGREEITLKNEEGKEYKYIGRPEEVKLLKFLEEKRSPARFPGDVEHQTEMSEFVVALIAKTETDKRMRNLCKKNTLIRITGDLEGTYRTIKQPFSPAVRERVVELARDSGKEVIEFINETLTKKD